MVHTVWSILYGLYIGIIFYPFILLAHPYASNSRNDRVCFSDCTLNSVGINQMSSIIRKRCSTCIHFILDRIDDFLKIIQNKNGRMEVVKCKGCPGLYFALSGATFLMVGLPDPSFIPMHGFWSSPVNFPAFSVPANHDSDQSKFMFSKAHSGTRIVISFGSHVTVDCSNNSSPVQVACVVGASVVGTGVVGAGVVS